MDTRQESDQTDTPAYVANGILYKYATSSRTPRKLTVADLQAFGFTKSNSSILLGSLKWLGLYDKAGNLVQLEELIGLGAKDEDIRRDAYKSLVNRAYKDLMADIPPEKATVDNVAYYFRKRRVADSISKKAARLYIWLAEQAGLRESDKTSEPRERKDSTQKSSNAEKPNEKSKSNSDELSGKALVLRTILDAIRIHANSSDIVELAKIASELGREIDAENKNHHTDDTPEPSDKKSIMDNRAIQGGD